MDRLRPTAKVAASPIVHAAIGGCADGRVERQRSRRAPQGRRLQGQSPDGGACTIAPALFATFDRSRMQRGKQAVASAASAAWNERGRSCNEQRKGQTRRRAVAQSRQAERWTTRTVVCESMGADKGGRAWTASTMSTTSGAEYERCAAAALDCAPRHSQRQPRDAETPAWTSWGTVAAESGKSTVQQRPALAAAQPSCCPAPPSEAWTVSRSLSPHRLLSSVVTTRRTNAPLCMRAGPSMLGRHSRRGTCTMQPVH